VAGGKGERHRLKSIGNRAIGDWAIEEHRATGIDIDAADDLNRLRVLSQRTSRLEGLRSPIRPISIDRSTGGFRLPDPDSRLQIS
jgi:hypothetical protein